MLLAAGCTTKKNTGFWRAYHNLTGHYNAYFNGNEAYKLAVKQYEKNYKDNFEEVLPVYIYPDAQEANSLKSSMDRALKKASKVISEHKITGKPKRKPRWRRKLRKKKYELLKKEMPEEEIYKNWIDDSYMLMGKAYFYSHEHYSAVTVFEYVAKEYDAYPIKYDALIFLMRTYAELKNYDQAQTVIDMLTADEELPEKKQKMFVEAYADFYMKQKMYEDVEIQLEKLLELEKKKDKLARYTYILAQIKKINNDLNSASKLFAKVVKYNPPYDMAFNATINEAMCYTGGNSDNLKKTLQKMLKDDKNIEYQDQIYYALADIYLKENNEPQGIDYLKKSVENSVSNDIQKGKSFLRLADIYFGKPNYVNAFAYYDSACMSLPTDYSNYKQIEAKKNSLQELVQYVKVLEYQDSVQKVAAMPEKERMDLIDELIKKAQEEEDKKQQQQQNQQYNNNQNYQQNNQMMGGAGSGKWYFYNPSAVSIGYNEFVKRFGQRKLEDNWRRSNKSIMSGGFANMGFGNDSTENDTVANDKLSEAYYLANLPLKPEQKKQSDSLIINALYNIGIIYKEKLTDFTNSVSSFEDLLQRYPQCNKEAATMYYLYLTYLQLNNQQQANFYKNKLIKAYPDSEYAHILVNPNYYLNKENKRKVIKDLYKTTYYAYKNNSYQSVITNAEIAGAKYSEDILMPNFLFLKALAFGKSNKEAEYVSALNNIIKTYPDSDVTPSALELYKHYLSKDKPIDTAKIMNNTQGLYKLNKDTVHFFILVINSSTGKTDKIKDELNNFNNTNFKKENLSISSVVLDNTYQLITVRKFIDGDAAMDYLKALKTDKIFKMMFTAPQYMPFAISLSNYILFYKEKDVDSYRAFFNDNY